MRQIYVYLLIKEFFLYLNRFGGVNQFHSSMTTFIAIGYFELLDAFRSIEKWWLDKHILKHSWLLKIIFNTTHFFHGALKGVEISGTQSL